MNNMPEVKIGIVAVSRDCFPESLSVNRRKALVDAYTKKYDAKDIYECPVCIVESEIHMVQALEDIKKAGCNALCVYLGNFGPEISETLLAKHFEGPKMFIAAAEETQDNLCQGRGDAYCGMLNASYNLQLRNVKAYIPEYPVGDAEDCADMIHNFLPIARAIEGEMERQIDLIEDGKKVVQETRRWDDDKEYSYPMRSKEDAQDYRYFPEPDLTPIVISDEWLDEIRSRQPEFRDEKQARYKEQFGLPEYDINIITEDKTLTDLFESCIELGAAAKEVSNWIMGDIMRLLKEKEMEASDIHFSPANLVKMIQMIESGAINRKVAKKVFEAIFDEDVDPEVYVEENGLKTVNDEGALRKVIEEIVANNPKSVEDYKAGKKKAMGFFVGQTMRAMKGKADPAMVNQILKEMLD